MVLKQIVRTSDAETWSVFFDDDGEVILVERTQTVWTRTGAAANQMMTEKIRRVIDLARREPI